MRRNLLIGKMLGVLVVLLALFVAVGIAEEERTDASGQWKYVLEDGGATIAGYVGEPSGDLVIPDELDGVPVTGIGVAAFEMYQDLISVVIPEGVTSIGFSAFAYCENLAGIVIPDSVTAIGSSAFYYCFSLTDVTIPASVTSIGDGAFMGSGLTSIIIPDGVTSVGDEMFSHCYRLSSVVISDSVTSIGDMAFYRCSNLAAMTIPASVTSIGEFAFYRCTGLSSVAIPDSVTRIASHAFAACSGLTSVTIPASVMNIDVSAFDAPNSGYHADEIDDDEVIYGSDKLILTVVRGSIAEQYAKENEIPYVLALPYKDLSVNEILSATVEILPEKVRGDLSDDDIKDLVAILRIVDTSNRDDSSSAYCGGQAVTFTLTMADGTEEIISAYNPFIIINGIGYRTDVCHKLSGLGGTIAQTPF
ncbi:MAG: leucine-rich repeat domain-containing protein [Clostridia bacterium]|nr:leucine-rich repeat domain-containing protein [Clostridia bacterium]